MSDRANVAGARRRCQQTYPRSFGRAYYSRAWSRIFTMNATGIGYVAGGWRWRSSGSASKGVANPQCARARHCTAFSGNKRDSVTRDWLSDCPIMTAAEYDATRLGGGYVGERAAGRGSWLQDQWLAGLINEVPKAKRAEVKAALRGREGKKCRGAAEVEALLLGHPLDRAGRRSACDVDEHRGG